MKLQLDKSWFESRIRQDEEFEVGVGTGTGKGEDSGEPEEDFAGTYAFGTLIQLMRREKGLTVEQLAERARVGVAEVVGIERDPRHKPRPRSVYQLADFFGLPQRALLKLSNVTEVHDEPLREAAYHFAANSSTVAELSREERAAMTEFVKVLSAQGDG